MYDVVALGELLIDFTPAGRTENGNMIFESNPGGAPANVLVLLAKLGRSCAFIGKVGDDQFGRFLKDVLEKNKVDTKGLVFSGEVNTTLAFVHLDEHGDRTFSFYRKPGADVILEKNEIDFNLIGSSKIFHFGSVSMTNEPARSATLEAARYARENNVIISYDPNLRPPLWDDLVFAKEVILEGMKYANILKISEEEAEFLTGINSLEKSSEYLANKYGIQLILITLGSKGSFYRRGTKIGCTPTFDVKTIDTTGAGDAFLSGLLFQVLESKKPIDEITDSEMRKFIEFANAAGSLSTTKKGAIPAMPTKEEILKCLTENKYLTKLNKKLGGV